MDSFEPPSAPALDFHILKSTRVLYENFFPSRMTGWLLNVLTGDGNLEKFHYRTRSFSSYLGMLRQMKCEFEAVFILATLERAAVD
jgi:hypothetical protein